MKMKLELLLLCLKADNAIVNRLKIETSMTVAGTVLRFAIYKTRLRLHSPPPFPKIRGGVLVFEIRAKRGVMKKLLRVS